MFGVVTIILSKQESKGTACRSLKNESQQQYTHPQDQGSPTVLAGAGAPRRCNPNSTSLRGGRQSYQATAWYLAQPFELWQWWQRRYRRLKINLYDGASTSAHLWMVD